MPCLSKEVPALILHSRHCGAGVNCTHNLEEPKWFSTCDLIKSAEVKSGQVDAPTGDATMQVDEALTGRVAEQLLADNGGSRRFRGDIVLMDGGMGRELLNLGVPQRAGLWSATSIVEEEYHPKVVSLHESFIKAGARTITTNNYAIQPMYYGRVFPGDWEARMLKDTEKAAELASQARANAGVEGVSVLGCLPPLVDSHRPDIFAQYIKSQGEAAVVEKYESIAAALLRGGVDKFLLETMNNWNEVRLVLSAIKKFDRPIFISISGELRDENLDEHPEHSPIVAKEVLKAKASGLPIDMLSFNCASPEKIQVCLETLKSSTMMDALANAGVKIGAYANCCDFVRVKHYDVRSNPQFRATRSDLKDDGGYAKMVKQWVDMGVTYVGGCCGCSPEMIQHLHDSLNPPENDI